MFESPGEDKRSGDGRKKAAPLNKLQKLMRGEQIPVRVKKAAATVVNNSNPLLGAIVNPNNANTSNTSNATNNY